ncbi:MULTISPECIES: AraC family ligand binding domain-containing protein [Streptomyces]|uniref:AraC family ligand binding domain-containing protein n=1 Tax=Streptomyces solicathayae TaxID=3081768 RepID=A0ABZ0LM33_9ACTN|nr:AraC family ligand binding domain-containing protein [Streptomyces sp. HUAS YS2]WOX19918.1 AraC family ligand binding domain-containing protein [Streptomyces sp. HUAS YS2]
MTSSGERAAYWRVSGLALEALDARFEQYAYPMHAHDTYSFGVTDHGAQSFACRGGRYVSAAGLVMAFNPDDPHDGQSAVEHGYRYRMLHLGEDHLRDVLADAAPGTAGCRSLRPRSWTTRPCPGPSPASTPRSPRTRPAWSSRNASPPRSCF